MVLADPGLVIVQPVEMDQKLHVAIERQQRIFAERMKRREENAGFQKSILHGLVVFFAGARPYRSITDRRGYLGKAEAIECRPCSAAVFASLKP